MMEGTIAYIVCSSPLEFYKTANNIDDIDAVLNFLYGLLGYQNSFSASVCKNNFFN